MLALDASYLPKSGKATPGLSHFWSGTAQKALWGLQVGLLSVIDVDHHFIDRITRQTTLHIIGLLRQDARLRCDYQGAKAIGKGRPRQCGGKVDFTQPDFDYFTLSYQDAELRIYSAVVNCPFLKRDIKLAYTQYLGMTGQPTHYKLYFSTDLGLSAWLIVK